MPPVPTAYHVVPIPLPLLLHPVASEYPYSSWILDAQASFGGVRLPVTRDGFRMYFEYARAVMRSPMSDAPTRHQAQHFASEIYRVNLEQYGTAPWLRNNHDNQPLVHPKRRYDGDAPSYRSAPGRHPEELYIGNPSVSSLASVSSVAGPSRQVLHDEPMDLDLDDDSDEDDDYVERASTPSPERERRRGLMRMAGTSSQRATAAMLNAKTTNMRGQWREGCVLVPVPNARGVEPPFNLSPLRTLASLHALNDVYLAMWLRFYDGNEAEVPSTRYAREIALCSRLGVLWSPSAPTSPVLGGRSPVHGRSPRSPSISPLQIQTQFDSFPPVSPPEGPVSAPASVGRPSPPPLEPLDIPRACSVPAINVTPPTPTDSPRGPLSAPPASPPHTYVSPSQYAYSYSQTHPTSYAYTHRYRHYPSSPNPAPTQTDIRNIDWESPTTRAYHAQQHIIGASQAAADENMSPSSPSQSGYKYVIRHGVKYAVRWTAD